MNRVVFAFMLAWSAGAAEPVTISPDQIVSNTLAYSLRLKVLDKDVAAAGAKVDQARAQELPLFSADARASQYTGLEDMYLGPFFHLPAIETRSGVGVGISQPLFTGGRLKNQKEGARQQQAAARHERQSASGDLALQALTAYWNWSKAVYAGEFLQAALARMEAHAVDMRNLHEAGLATDNDSLSTDVLLERTRLRFEEARRRVEVAQARIVFLTGQPLATNSLPEKTAAAVPPPRSEDLLLQAAQTNRPERAARQNDVQVAEAQVRVTRADYYPQVSLFARYEDARPNLNNIPPLDKWQDDAYAGVALSWNIFDWGLRKARVAEAKARSDQARLRLGQTEDQIVLEVREARINVQDVRQRLEVSQRAFRSAQRNLEAATDLWKGGLSRHSDVLDALSQLTDTEYEVTTARADLALAQAALDHAVGQLGTGKPAKPPERSAAP